MRTTRMIRNNIVRLLFTFGIIHTVFGWSNSISLNDLAKSFHLQLKQEKDKIYLSNSQNHWIFQENSKEASLNATKIFLTYTVQSKLIGGKNLQKIYSIHSIDKEKLISVLQHSKKFPIKTIVIDPGHGGKAEGAINKTLNIKEKDLNLKVAQQLAQQLKNLGFTIYLTHAVDKDLTLKDRSEFANKMKADILISIHHNSSTAQTPCGIEVYTYSFAGHPSTDRNTPVASDKVVAPVNSYDQESTFLAFNLQKNIIKQTKLNDRGVRRGRMGVLNGLKCPGVLIECGFISNPQEAKTLLQETYQKKLIQGICDAIQQCNKTRIVPSKTSSNKPIIPKIFTHKKLQKNSSKVH